jgi:probable F420-dependent oxidoreductase
VKLDAALWLDGLDRVPEVARTAERLGFDAIWTAETAHNPILPLVLAAEHTSRLRLGTAIAVAFARSPMDLACQAWDLARYSNGRFILGLGTQVEAHITRRFAMTWPSPPADALRDYVGAVRAIWAAWQNGTRLNYRGEFYKITLMAPFFDPGPIPHPAIPIFTAGVNRLMCRLAGEVSDGFHGHPLHSRRYLRELVLPAIADGAKAAGRLPHAVEVSSAVLVATGDTQAEIDRSVEAARQQISFYASTPAYGPVLELHGWGEAHAALRHLAPRQRWEDMPQHVSDDMVDTYAVVGTWSELPALLHARYDGLLDRVTLYMPFDTGPDDAHWADVCAAFRPRP